MVVLHRIQKYAFQLLHRCSLAMFTETQFKYYNMFALLSSTETKIDNIFDLHIMPKGFSAAAPNIIYSIKDSVVTLCCNKSDAKERNTR